MRCSKNILDVFQKEFAISSRNSEKHILSTTHVITCTVAYGFDQASGLGFLAHFDLPCSGKYIGKIFDELTKFQLPPNHNFTVNFCGGNCNLWSRVTQKQIKHHLELYAKSKGVRAEAEFELPQFDKPKSSYLSCEFNLKENVFTLFEDSEYCNMRDGRPKNVGLLSSLSYAVHVIPVHCRLRPVPKDRWYNVCKCGSC